jgi:hypothetical protein
MSNLPVELRFSRIHSSKRIEKAHQRFGDKVVTRIIGLALFLLGAKREDIARYLEIPLGTFLSFLTRADQYGLLAFQDRRSSVSEHVVKTEVPVRASSAVTDKNVLIELGGDHQAITIPLKNQLQCKVILLTFLNNELLTTKEVSDILGLSERRIRDLNVKMHGGDVYELIDKRKGQTQDYRFTPDIKAELIQQVAANAITGKPTSSRAVSQQIKERCNLVLPDRTVRLHMNKLGLPKISISLPDLVEDLKKSSKP